MTKMTKLSDLNFGSTHLSKIKFGTPIERGHQQQYQQQQQQQQLQQNIINNNNNSSFN